jgi:hypothetical protein
MSRGSMYQFTFTGLFSCCRYIAMVYAWSSACLVIKSRRTSSECDVRVPRLLETSSCKVAKRRVRARVRSAMMITKDVEGDDGLAGSNCRLALYCQKSQRRARDLGVRKHTVVTCEIWREGKPQTGACQNIGGHHEDHFDTRQQEEIEAQVAVLLAILCNITGATKGV